MRKRAFTVVTKSCHLHDADEISFRQRCLFKGLAKLSYALVKLAISSTAHGRIVSPINFGDLVSLDVLDLVHGNVSGKRNSQVVAQGQNFAALILEIVDQLGVLAVFAS